MAISPPTPPPPVPAEICDGTIVDPPPPYPSRERRSRASRAHRRQHSQTQASQHSQVSSGDTLYSYDAHISTYAADDEEPTETTPFVSNHRHRGVPGRPRSQSFTSTMSAAPSLAHTVLSLFQAEEESDLQDAPYDRHPFASADENAAALSSPRPGTGFFSRAAWRRYFRPMTVRAYYRSLFHLAVVNLPYGLAAWVYLFVFTVTGTTLLVVLPIGAMLCFFDLVGARAFSRGELALQSRFHAPLAHAPPYPPRPIFTRYRQPTTEEIESGQRLTERHGLIHEKSFYKNTYAMFTDPTSYQALFYFLVIKPAITLLISIGIVTIGIPAFILVLPAPAFLRAVRKIGSWQANVAIEGLYFAVS